MARARKKPKAAPRTGRPVEPAPPTPPPLAEPESSTRPRRHTCRSVRGPGDHAAKPETAARVAAALDAAPSSAEVSWSNRTRPDVPAGRRRSGEAPQKAVEHQSPPRRTGRARAGPAPLRDHHPRADEGLAQDAAGPQREIQADADRLRQKPDEQYLALLRNAGWKWRDAEKIGPCSSTRTPGGGPRPPPSSCSRRSATRSGRPGLPPPSATAARPDASREELLAQVEGRVGMWRGGLGEAYPFPPFRPPVPH